MQAVWRFIKYGTSVKLRFKVVVFSYLSYASLLENRNCFKLYLHVQEILLLDLKIDSCRIVVRLSYATNTF